MPNLTDSEMIRGAYAVKVWKEDERCYKGEHRGVLFAIWPQTLYVYIEGQLVGKVEFTSGPLLELWMHVNARRAAEYKLQQEQEAKRKEEKEQARRSLHDEVRRRLFGK